MNLQIINGYAGNDPGLHTEGTDPGQTYIYSYLSNKKHQFCFAICQKKNFLDLKNNGFTCTINI